MRHLPVSPHQKGPQTESECIHLALAGSNARIPNEEEQEIDVPNEVRHLLVLPPFDLAS